MEIVMMVGLDMEVLNSICDKVHTWGQKRLLQP